MALGVNLLYMQNIKPMFTAFKWLKELILHSSNPWATWKLYWRLMFSPAFIFSDKKLQCHTAPLLLHCKKHTCGWASLEVYSAIALRTWSSMCNFKGKIKLFKLTPLENSQAKMQYLSLTNIFFCQTKGKVSQNCHSRSPLCAASKLKKF